MKWNTPVWVDFLYNKIAWVLPKRLVAHCYARVVCQEAILTYGSEYKETRSYALRRDAARKIVKRFLGEGEG